MSSSLQDPPSPTEPPPIEHHFQVGDWAVHPSHGVGKVERIEEKDLGGTVSEVYVLEIRGSDLKVIVPKMAASRVGLRPVMSREEAESLFDVLAAAESAVKAQPWNRRFRAYSEMLSSGSPTEIAKVLRDMHRLKFDKELSFGERRLLDQALSLLKEEMALATESSADEVDVRINDIFSP